MPIPDGELPTPHRRAADPDGRGAPRQALPIGGRRLTRLLARWADARRLDTRQAEAIRLAVRTVPGDLGFDWWWRLLDPENGSVFRATAARPAPGGPGWLSGEPPLSPDGPAVMDWLQDRSEYQPYLRLA